MNHMAASFKEECVGRRDRYAVAPRKKMCPKYGRYVHDWFHQEPDTVVFYLRVACAYVESGAICYNLHLSWFSINSLDASYDGLRDSYSHVASLLRIEIQIFAHV